MKYFLFIFILFSTAIYAQINQNEDKYFNYKFIGDSLSLYDGINILNFDFSKIDSKGTYTLSFLAAGTYDLIIASTDANGNVLVEKQIKGVIVESKKTTTQNSSL